MTYVVTRHWEVCDKVVVEADCLWDAIEAAHAQPLDNAKAAYVPGSNYSDSTRDLVCRSTRKRQRIPASPKRKPHTQNRRKTRY